ncbi:MAG TPA: ABC transporter permease [Mycobacteriales bacterium]|nr:ABC transporter permease [Mycobacteriales bacterium]
MTSTTLGSGGWRSAFEYWLLVYRRTWRGSVVTSIVSPALFLAAMGIGLGSLVHGGTGRVDGVRYAVYLAPGLLAAAVMQSVEQEATWPVMGAIKWDRTYLGMLATPLTVADVLLGHLLFIGLRALIVATSFTIVTALFGLAHSPGGALLALLGGVLTGTAFATPIAAFAATQSRDTGFILLYRFGVIPLFLFSGTFFPISQLPGALQPIAWITPLWHGVSLCRDVALGRGSAWVIGGHAAYLLVLTLLGIALAHRTYRRRLRW